MQLRYAKAADYWQKAAELLPEGEKKDRAYCLSAAGYDLYRHCIVRHSEVTTYLWEQSLSVNIISDKAGEDAILSNLNQNDYNKALSLYKQSLSISREVGSGSEEGTTRNNITWIYHHARGKCDKLSMYFNTGWENIAKSEEGTLLNNISQIYKAQGDYNTALSYLEQSLTIQREVVDRVTEGIILNDLAMTVCAKGDINVALSYLEQSLVIRQEIGDRDGEAVTSWNIGLLYKGSGRSC